MRLFRRRQTAKPGAIIGTEYVPNQVESTSRPSWIRILIRILIVVLILALLILGFLFVRGLFDDSKPNKAELPVGQTVATGVEKAGSDVGNQISQPSKNGNSQPTITTPSPNSPKKGASSSTSSNSSSSKSTATTSQLSNTGPGDVAMIFAAAATIGTASHQLYLRKKSHNPTYN